MRFVFDQNAMSKVPPGLYDVRFEVRKDDEIQKGVFEYQYNAVRVFDQEPEEHEGGEARRQRARHQGFGRRIPTFFLSSGNQLPATRTRSAAVTARIFARNWSFCA